MKSILRASLLAIGAALVSTQALAEPISFFMPEDVSYSDAVPAPEDSFGYEIGSRPVRHGDMVMYLREVAAASDRVSVETIGYTHEQRPILFFTVTSPENQSRIDEIREAHLARMRGEAVAEDTPLVLWINFGVHGAESSGMDAAMPALYHYAAASDAAVGETLDDTVILFTAVFNPDGHSRRVNHVETFFSQAQNTDPADIIHNLWVEARTNHYWFDLNRQWLLLTQPEAQAWIGKWHEWKPMVSADYHEMGSSSPFYFHPGEALRRNPLIPERARELTYRIGQQHTSDFLDPEGRLYTTQEGFDNFYIGKGSTYPQINGSLGILFEIGAARGGEIETDRGLVTHGDNVRTQFRTVLTTVEGARNIRDELIDYQRSYFEQSARMASQDNRRAYVFTAAGDPERANRFVRLLRMHDIEVYELESDVRADGRTYSAGQSFIVPMNQTQHRMIRGIFDQVTEFEENIFYDVSGWTLPLAYDLDYSALSGLRSVSWSDDLATGAFEAAPAPDVAPYGYVLEWSHTYAPRALNRILSAGLYARAGAEPVTGETTRGRVELGRGAVFVPYARQDMSRDDIHALMETIAAEDGVTVHALTSGLTPNDGADFGAAGIFQSLEAPKVLLAFDDGLSRYDAGEMWWTLDHQHDMEVTLVRKNSLGGLTLSDYSHIIMVGGNARLSSSAQDSVEDWIRRDGGTLIATRQAAVWAQEAFFDREEEEEEERDEPLARLNASEMAVREAEHIIGGALFETDLDISHPLGFGFNDRTLPVQRNMTSVLIRPEDDPYAVVAEYTDAPLLSGYASERRQTEIAGTPAVVAERLGRGSVIMMADNPVFRATFPGSERLLMNAIFFSGMIDGARGVYEEE